MIRFLLEAISSFKQTGSIVPSSRALSRRITASLGASTTPRRVLEVGSGTGAFTKAILERLEPGDSLDTVEVNPAFCDHLQKEVVGPFQDAHPDISVRILNDLIQDADLSGTYDHIICGLPFNNFPLHVVRLIFRVMFDHLTPSGDLSFFEYWGFRGGRYPVSGPATRRMLRNRLAHGAAYRQAHRGRRSVVWVNVPPAWVITLGGSGEDDPAV
jgi:phosphatidylethanolamine/phosphatidyl-N-methylethanolamine N-methyltransferase